METTTILLILILLLLFLLKKTKILQKIFKKKDVMICDQSFSDINDRQSDINVSRGEFVCYQLIS